MKLKILENKEELSDLEKLGNIVKKFKIGERKIDGNELLSGEEKSKKMILMIDFLIEILQEVDKMSEKEKRKILYGKIGYIVEQLNFIYSLDNKIPDNLKGQNGHIPMAIKIINKYVFKNIGNFINILNKIKEEKFIKVFSRNMSQEQSVLATNSYEEFIKSLVNFVRGVKECIRNNKLDEKVTNTVKKNGDTTAGIITGAKK